MKNFGLVPMTFALALTIILAQHASATHSQEIKPLVDALQTLQDAQHDYRELVQYFGEESQEAVEAHTRIEAASRVVAAREVQHNRELLLIENSSNQASSNQYGAL